MSQAIDSTLKFLNYPDNPNEEIVPLTPDDLETARSLSQRISDPSKQWPVYLNALALSGIRQWLKSRSISFRLHDEQSVIIEPTIADGIGAVCGLVANQFRISLIAIEPNDDPIVPIPKTVFDRVHLKSHLYLFISIYEEQEAIGLRGHITHDQLPTTLSSEQDYYTIPTDRLTTDFNLLLLHLTCLEPTLIQAPQQAPTPIRQILTQPLLNTSRWFQTQLQGAIESAVEMTEELAWQLMQPMSFASALRELPVAQDWNEADLDYLMPILRDLAMQGVQLVPEARSAVRRLNLGDLDLQLYAIVSPLMNTLESIDEWSLLLILKRSDHQPLGRDIQLEVHTSCSTEVVQQVTSSDLTGYLFTEIIATQDESLSITLAHPDSTTLTLPPMQYLP
jgi:hypothetical protein